MSNTTIPYYTIIGSFLSPYVRKVLVTCQLKKVPFVIDPIVPFYGNDDFTILSPHRRIPVLLLPTQPTNTPTNNMKYSSEDCIVDSTVICEYLNEQFNRNNNKDNLDLLPTDPLQRARVRWMEEYADSVMGDVIIWRLFNATIIDPGVWKAPRNKEAIESIKAKEIPQIWDYLEKQLTNPNISTTGKFFVGNSLTSADIAIASFLRNAELARVTVPSDMYPKLSMFADYMLHHMPEFVSLREFEDVCLKIAPPQQRDALIKSVPRATQWLSQKSFFRHAEPRKGLLTRVFDGNVTNNNNSTAKM
jgi:glutathione S-transferase